MYKYVFTEGNMHISTPKVDKFSDIKTNAKVLPGRIETHSEYPNGLIVDVVQTSNKIEFTTNKRIIQLENGSLCFEE